MSVRIVRQADLVRTPWKNGGGTTAEIAAAPLGADLDNFDWRISMADVATEGPFSLFKGVDRTLALIEGSGVEVVVEGETHSLNEASRLIGFSGEAAVSALLPLGPIRDLNVMTRRPRFTHRMRLVPRGEYNFGPSEIIAAVALEPTTIAINHGSERLSVLDLAIIDQDAAQIATDAALILIEITAR